MAPLPKHQRVIIALAIHILRTGVARWLAVRAAAEAFARKEAQEG